MDERARSPDVAELDWRVGIDLGGTKVAAGLIAGEKLVEWSSRPTRAHLGLERVAESTVEQIAELLESNRQDPANIAAVGLGLCGDFDPVSGEIKTAPNTPAFVGTRPQTVFADAWAAKLSSSCPVVAENDASVAALAEGRLGAGRGVGRFFYMTISTGIGGARFDGHSAVNAEPGVYLFPDVERPRTSLNDLAGGMALARQARDRLEDAQERGGEEETARTTDLFRLGLAAGPTFKQRLDRITARTLGEAAGRGDAFARRLLDQAADHVAAALALVLEQGQGEERLVIGGSVGLKAPRFLDRVRRSLLDLQRTSAPSSALARFDVARGLVGAQLGDERGVLGAVILSTLPPPPSIQVLITEAAGEAGQRLLERLTRRWRVLGGYRESPRPGLTHLDVTDRESLAASLGQVRPDVVIHPGASLDEAVPEGSATESTDVLVEACRRAGCGLMVLTEEGSGDLAPAVNGIERLSLPTHPASKDSAWLDALASRLDRALRDRGLEPSQP